MFSQRACDLLHWLQARAHRASTPTVQELPRPIRRAKSTRISTLKAASPGRIYGSDPDSSPRFCRRPLFIMTDQQRGDCLGIEGHPVLQTPYLDHVAASGIRFSRAYSACPVCTPARRGRRHVRSLFGLLSVDCAGTILDDQPGR